MNGKGIEMNMMSGLLGEESAVSGKGGREC